MNGTRPTKHGRGAHDRLRIPDGDSGGGRPRRYLWTDAFAVCNLLGLYHGRGDERYRELALRTVEQVHLILGRHREDDPRRGWLSGLSEEEGLRHPTIGGLRIGKRLPERRPGEPLDEALEWSGTANTTTISPGGCMH